uniref:Secreted protein n=1 Tax=Anopheles coluzzii TaxID=1518534 RepID=A0A8W7PM37_ANOCL
MPRVPCLVVLIGLLISTIFEHLAEVSPPQRHAPDVCHFLHDALLTVTVFDLLAQMCDIFRGVRPRVVVLKILSSIPRKPDPITAKINKPPSWCCCYCCRRKRNVALGPVHQFRNRTDDGTLDSPFCPVYKRWIAVGYVQASEKKK